MTKRKRSKREEEDMEAYLRILKALALSGFETKELLQSAIRFLGGERGLAKAIAADNEFRASPDFARLMSIAHNPALD